MYRHRRLATGPCGLSRRRAATISPAPPRKCSTLIRFHLEKKYRLDLDANLDAKQRAAAWAVERMCEDHLYFAILDMRWIDTVNFNNGLGRTMFGSVPAPVRPIVKSMLRRMNAKRLHGHGIGRHPRSVIA